MNRMLLFLFCNIFLLSCSSQKSDTLQIKECFAKCQKAIVNMNGEVAIDLISEKTKIEYSNLLEKIKQLDSTQLSQEEFSSKLFILKVRYLLSPDQIHELNNLGLLMFAINKGISNNNNIGNSTLDKITINDSSAIATLIINRKKSPFIYSFSKENNQWKIRLRTSLHTSYKKLFPDSAILENDFINNQLIQLSDKSHSHSIWQPIQ